MRIIKWFHNLFFKKQDRIDELKSEMFKEKKKSLNEIRKINRAFRLLIDEGSIEITIKNVDGVLKDL